MWHHYIKGFWALRRWMAEISLERVMKRRWKRSAALKTPSWFRCSAGPLCPEVKLRTSRWWTCARKPKSPSSTSWLWPNSVLQHHLCQISVPSSCQTGKRHALLINVDSLWCARLVSKEERTEIKMKFSTKSFWVSSLETEEEKEAEASSLDAES